MKKRLLIALVLVLALAATASVVWGEPGMLYVDDDGVCGGNSPCYMTIQAAVTAATSGDTIVVYAGTYTENVTVAKGLTLTAESGATIDGGIWIKDLHTFTSPITVENFTIENGWSLGAYHYGINISGSIGEADQPIKDMHIVNNTLTNVATTATVAGDAAWVWPNVAIAFEVNDWSGGVVPGGRHDTYFPGTGEISYNTIVNDLGDATKTTQLGIGVFSGLNMKINHNNISGNVAEGIHHWGPTYTANTGNYEINHNTIDLSGWIGDPMGNNPRGIWSYAGQSSVSYNTVISKWIGIVLRYWDDTAWGGGSAGPNYSLTVAENVIHPPAGESMTVGLRISGSNSQVTDNEIYGATDTTRYGVGLLFEGFGVPEWGESTECSHNTFTANYIHDNYDGIWTWGAPYDNTLDNVFHYNNIVGNTNSGMTNNHVGEMVNAKNNWWGCADGPGATGCDTVSSDVDYNPWITGLAYTGETLFPAGTSLVLQATLSNSTDGASGATVEFFLDGASEGSAITDEFGVASLDIGTRTVGVYTVRAVALDPCLEAEALLAVYDPTAGFVTGGGWIWSEPGAYMADTSLEGKATFGFVSKYQKGATIPTGQTEFQFKVANLNFHSSSYEWLVIANARAQYKGTGTINGAGNYGFMLTAIDGNLLPNGQPDRFRIKIWDKDTDTMVYDNQLGADDTAEPSTVIGGGSIVIHKK